jgi:hypothetical protein
LDVHDTVAGVALRENDIPLRELGNLPGKTRGFEEGLGVKGRFPIGFQDRLILQRSRAEQLSLSRGARHTRLDVPDLAAQLGKRRAGLDDERLELPLREHGAFDTQMQPPEVGVIGHATKR